MLKIKKSSLSLLGVALAFCNTLISGNMSNEGIMENVSDRTELACDRNGNTLYLMGPVGAEPNDPTEVKKAISKKTPTNRSASRFIIEKAAVTHYNNRNPWSDKPSNDKISTTDELIQDKIPYALYIKSKTGDLIAGVFGYLIESKNTKKYCFLHSIWVHEKYRRKKFGAQLITALKQHAKANGCSSIHTSVSDNEPIAALLFFERLGFERTITMTGKEWQRIDHMEKKI